MLKNSRLLLSIGAAILACALAACGGGGGGSSGGGGASSSASSSTATRLSLTIHYKRLDGDYTGWGAHLWNDASGTPAVAADVATVWTSPRPFDGVTDGWATLSVPLANLDANLHFLIHKGDAKSPVTDMVVNPSVFGKDVYVVQDTLSLAATPGAGDAAFARLGHQADALDLSAVAPGATASALPAGWSRNAQIMEIFVRSYKDSDGDGIGDLKGLTSQLDYLKSLGVTGLWLMPIYRSGDHDHGYAVADYRSIDPDYGTMADFDTLVAEAHKRGIGIILDYVMNHASSQNPLFLDAVSSTANSRRDWFLWNASDPGWSAFNGASWHVSESGYYYGIFSTDMPDWNLTNAAVVDYHLDNLRFWLNRGVDGFRFDGAEYLIENGPNAYMNQPQTLSLLQRAKAVIDGYANRYMVCEAPDAPDDFGTACGHAFAFGHQDDIKTSAASGKAAAGLIAYLNAPDRAQLPLFLSNHDAFAGARPYPDLSGHGEGDYRAAAAIELLASDTPFTLYGEEVGMADNADSGDNAIRAPMSWTGDAATAGFTTGTPYRGLSVNAATHNVAAEQGVAGSLLETYRGLYAARSHNPVLQSGTLTPLSAAGQSYVAFLRQSGGKTAVVAINLSATAQTVTLNTGLAAQTFTGAYPNVGGSHTADAGGKLSLDLPAEGAVVVTTP